MSRMYYMLCMLLVVCSVHPLKSADLEKNDQEQTTVVGQDEQSTVDMQAPEIEKIVEESKDIQPEDTQVVKQMPDELAEPEVVKALEQIEVKTAPELVEQQEIISEQESQMQPEIQQEQVVEEQIEMPSQEVTPEEAPAIEESIPLPPDPAQEPMVEDVEVEEPQGIDTVDINEPEGNWLFKRIWWERSKDLFGKIRDYVDRIVESRMHFFEQRVKFDHERLDPFYIKIGMDQGSLTEQIGFLLKALDSEREKDGVLDEHDLEWYAALTEEKETLKQFSEAVNEIERLDGSFDDSLKVLMNQINLARSYEREAWQLLNRIAEELSDKKAREDYYAIATLWRNVKEIGSYITGPFSQYFVQLVATTEERIKQIEQAVATLKEKGIELSHAVESHEHEDEQPEQDLEAEPAVQSVGWLSWFWQTITGWFTW